MSVVQGTFFRKDSRELRSLHMKPREPGASDNDIQRLTVSLTGRAEVPPSFDIWDYYGEVMQAKWRCTVGCVCGFLCELWGSVQQRWSLHSDNGGERRGAMWTATEGQALSVLSRSWLRLFLRVQEEARRGWAFPLSPVVEGTGHPEAVSALGR